MPGDDWQRLANLRLLYTYMYTLPGRKLLFMGGEFGQQREWNEAQPLDWHLLEQPPHQGLQTTLRDLNRLVSDHPALHGQDFEASGFEWLDCDDADHSTLSYLRRSGDDWLLVCLNFTPVVRDAYRVGVPESGRYVERFNSDSGYYGGSNVGNGTLTSEPQAYSGRPCSLRLTLPPLGALILSCVPYQSHF
jgi:1,4-alpha-glucan branching enzyme